jgi:hypothetical protein
MRRSALPFRGTLGWCSSESALGANALHEHACRFVALVLRNDFTTERLDHDGLIQMLDQFAGGIPALKGDDLPQIVNRVHMLGKLKEPETEFLEGRPPRSAHESRNRANPQERYRPERATR